jgi:hypothetical protein
MQVKPKAAQKLAASNGKNSKLQRKNRVSTGAGKSFCKD